MHTNSFAQFGVSSNTFTLMAYEANIDSDKNIQFNLKYNTIKYLKTLVKIYIIFVFLSLCRLVDDFNFVLQYSLYVV